jgi:hypothetical protein
MKKLNKVAYSVMGFIVLCLLFGCLDGKPSSWNINEGKWELWSEGEIASLEDLKEGEATYKEILFSNGHSIVMGAIKDPGRIKVGSIGKLYKNNLGNADNVSWFQWIANEDDQQVKIDEATDLIEKIIKREKTAKEEKSSTIKAEIAKPVDTTGSWNNGDKIEDLKVNDLVLIELDDGIITTGFVTYDRQWKLGTNKNKYQHGRTLDSVQKWKRINLE